LLRGRVLAREGNELRVKTESGEKWCSPAGAARPGDIVTIGDKGEPAVIVDFGGRPYPYSDAEASRLSLKRINGLKVRATILKEIRRYFDEKDFLEVEPPTLVRAPGLEVNIKAVRAGQGYLITSPEFHMKRLLAGGVERIFATSRCFRAEEEGKHHSVEFTMLEWYRAWASLEDIISDTEQLVSRAVSAVRKRKSARVANREVDLTPPWQRLTVAEAFRRWVGFTLIGYESFDALRQKMVAASIDPGNATHWDELFYTCFVERIQPGLAKMNKAVLLTDWPVALAALARCNPQSPEWAYRFEAYVGGVELANAFDELTDPAEQQTRFEQEQQTRRERGLEVYPIDARFMTALREGLPPCAGIALGVDRLAMLAAGASELKTVSAFVGDEL
jgi:lysyl-tRNA synthetase class 2